MNTKGIGAMIIVIICVIILLPSNSLAETVVSFPDEALEQAVRNRLREWHYPLTVEKLAKLTTLEAQQAGIKNLSGLEYAVNLKKLDLTDNQISDLSPLRGLQHLEYLNLKWNNISDITPLRGLTNLTILGLENNKITDISPLSSLTGLTRLNLGVNNISRVDALRQLINLEQLVLYFNNISDIGPLAGLIRLQVLNLADNQISDISPVVRNMQAGGLVDGFVNLTHNSLNISEGYPAMDGITILLDGDVAVTSGSQGERSTLAPIQTAIEAKVPRGIVTTDSKTKVEVVPDGPLVGPESVANIFTQVQIVIILLLILLVLYTLTTMVFVKHDKSLN